MKLQCMVSSVLVCLFLVMVNVSAQTQNGCVGGKRNGIYYTDCWADPGDDTNRLQSAINNIISGAPNYTGSGKLIFNEGTYQISNTLTLNSNLILEGTSSSAGATTISSRINLTASNRSVFLINGGVTDIAIRDLGLSLDPSTSKVGTVGIEGYNSNGLGSSSNFQFGHLFISGFERGIYVHTLNDADGFQFDNVRLDRAAFEACGTAIELNSSNTGWTMNNLNIISGAGGNGINIIRGGYISMNLVVGNGYTTSQPPYTPPGPIPLSGTFIRIRKQAVTSIQNSISENFTKTLDIDTPSRDHPIVLTNNDFAEGVEINNSTVVSNGNFYGNNWKVSNPIIKGNSNVFSIGDSFCWQGSQYCAASKFVVQGTTATLQQMASSDDSSTDLTRPALKIQQPSINKTLLELGNYNSGGEFVYRLKRDNQGRLSFSASQADPWKGYNFDGPVRLASYNLSTLNGLGTPINGDMAFCIDCLPNTSPCQSGGTGALAINSLPNGLWSCK